MESLTAAAFGALLIPPGLLVFLLLAALVLARWRPHAARILLLCTTAALYTLSTPCVSGYLLQQLQSPWLDPRSDGSGEAIVVLGGGTYFDAPEYGGDTASALTLIRVRYAAHLFRLTGKPLLAAGGSLSKNHPPESAYMKELLEREFQVPVTWVEETSRDTLGNARGSFQVLRDSGIRRIYLVTHAWHMPRARFAFESAGFSVIPTPTGYATSHPFNLSAFLPSAQALLGTSWFFHETIGLGWYHLRVAIGR